MNNLLKPLLPFAGVTGLFPAAVATARERLHTSIAPLFPLRKPYRSRRSSRIARRLPVLVGTRSSNARNVFTTRKRRIDDSFVACPFFRRDDTTRYHHRDLLSRLKEDVLFPFVEGIFRVERVVQSCVSSVQNVTASAVSDDSRARGSKKECVFRFKDVFEPF